MIPPEMADNMARGRAELLARSLNRRVRALPAPGQVGLLVAAVLAAHQGRHTIRHRAALAAVFAAVDLSARERIAGRSAGQ